jgi:luciferase family oxidoreductase group 1
MMQGSIAQARVAEACGLDRYWLAEHHSPALAAASLEPMLATIAASTSRIRVGSAGVLLRNYSPLKVAETFRTLAGLFPGRIDLGIGRSTGAVGRLMEALCDGRPMLTGADAISEDFRQRLASLMGCFREARQVFEADGKSYPGLMLGKDDPQIWLLGSGTESAALAAQMGTRVAITLFYGTNVDAASVIAKYRRDFISRDEAPTAEACIALAGVCAPTDEAARDILDKTPNRFLAQNANFCGSPRRCRDSIVGQALHTGARHVVLKLICHRLEDQLEAIRLIAEAMSSVVLPPPILVCRPAAASSGHAMAA